MCAWIYILIRPNTMKPCRFLPFCCQNSLNPWRCGRRWTLKDPLRPVSCDVGSLSIGTVCPRRHTGSRTELHFWKSSDPVSQLASTRLKFLDLLVFSVSYTNLFGFYLVPSSGLFARWRDKQCCSLHLSVVIVLSLRPVCTHACPGHVCSTEIKKN